MPWGKVDDNHYDHPKVLSIPRVIRNAADGLYWRAISRCNRTLSDGWLTAGDLDVIDSDPELVDALVAAGLWERKADGRLRIHDYLAHNKSKAEVIKERRTKAEAGRSGGLASGRARAKQTRNQTRSRNEAPASQSVEPPSSPVPTRPDRLGSDEPDALSAPRAGESDEPYRTLEELTGDFPVQRVEPNAIRTLDALCDRRGIPAVLEALRAEAPGIETQPPGPWQLIAAARNRLEPFASGKPTKPEVIGKGGVSGEDAERAFGIVR